VTILTLPVKATAAPCSRCAVCVVVAGGVVLLLLLLSLSASLLVLPLLFSLLLLLSSSSSLLSLGVRPDRAGSKHQDQEQQADNPVSFCQIDATASAGSADCRQRVGESRHSYHRATSPACASTICHPHPGLIDWSRAGLRKLIGSQPKDSCSRMDCQVPHGGGRFRAKTGGFWHIFEGGEGGFSPSGATGAYDLVAA
jgi:hypothetical protein